jgi:hypothetical protein
MQITDQWLMDNRTKAGAWTRAQLAVIGIDWPPYHGWKQKVIGQVISEQTASAFVSAANLRSKRTKKNDAKKQRISDELDLLIVEQNRDRMDFSRWRP